MQQSFIPNPPIPLNISSPIQSPLTSPQDPSALSLMETDTGANTGIRNGKANGEVVEKRSGKQSRLAEYTSDPHEVIPPPLKKSKARKREYLNLKEKENMKQIPMWPKFYVINKEIGDFSQECSIQLCRKVHSMIGKAANVKKTASGKIHVETTDSTQSKLVSELRQLGDIPVTVTPNKRLNTSQGVIYCRDLLISTEDDILEELTEQGVIEVRRIRRRVGGSLHSTPTLVLTFECPQPAQVVTIAYYKLSVRPYVPSPMRCFKCLRFGHTSSRCKAQEAMCGCGLVLHGDSACRDPPICINCAANHNTRSPSCPVMLEEKEIQKLKTEKKMSYFEAKNIVKSKSYVKTNKTFAQATCTTKGKGREMSTQTESIQPSTQTVVGGSTNNKPVVSAPREVACGTTTTPQPSATSTTMSEAGAVASPPLREVQGPMVPSSADRVEKPDLPPPRSARVPRRRPVNSPVLTSGSDRSRDRTTPKLKWGISGDKSDSASDSGDSNKTYLSWDSGDLRPDRTRKKKMLPKLQKS